MSTGTYEYKGHTITVDHDDMGVTDSPRDWDNLGTMACCHGRYNLGDEQVDPEGMTVECPACNGSGELDGVTVESHAAYGERLAECPKCEGTGELADPVQWAVDQGATVVIGLYLYDHSGISMKASTLYRDGQRVDGGNPFTCQWDSGMVGVMFDTPERRGVMGTPLELIEECLHGEVREYDDYLTGDVYYYSIKGPLCDDACYGFYPDHSKQWREALDYVRREAEAVVDSAVEWEAGQVEAIGRVMAL